MDVLASVSFGEVRTDVDAQVRTLAGRPLTLGISAATSRSPR
jgi:hypothetical protein